MCGEEGYIKGLTTWYYFSISEAWSVITRVCMEQAKNYQPQLGKTTNTHSPGASNYSLQTFKTFSLRCAHRVTGCILPISAKKN